MKIFHPGLFSMARDFSKSTTCFSRSPEQKSAFSGIKSTAEIFLSVPSAFKGICVSPPPLAPAYCSKPPSCVSLHHALKFCFFIIYCKLSLMFWTVCPVPLDSHAPSLFPRLPPILKTPFSQAQFQMSCKISPTVWPTSWSNFCAVCYAGKAKLSSPPF